MIQSICQRSVSRESIITLSPLPPLPTMLTQWQRFSSYGDDGALFNIVLQGEGALNMNTLVLGHRFKQTIKMLRTFFRHLSTMQIIGYALVAVVLHQGTPMHYLYGGGEGGALYMGTPVLSHRSIQTISLWRHACRHLS